MRRAAAALAALIAALALLLVGQNLLVRIVFLDRLLQLGEIQPGRDLDPHLA